MKQEEAKRLTAANLEQAERRVAQIEKLLEVSSAGDLVARIDRLRPYFRR